MLDTGKSFDAPYFFFACNFAVCACLSVWAGPSPAQPADHVPQVLILNSYDESTAPFTRARSAFMTELQQRRQEPVAFRQFDLEARGAGETAGQELKAELLRSQYANSPPGLVIALGPPAIGFWLEYRDRMFPAIPFIALTDQDTLAQVKLRPGDAAAVTRFSFTEVVEGILELLPETRRILMVFGASDLERGLAARARQELANAFPGLDTEFTNDLDLRQLQQRLATLPPDTAVLNGIFDSDVSGVLMHEHSGLLLVRAASSAPVFSPFEDQLGMGILGGRLVQLERLGKEAAALAERILSGERVGNVPLVVDLTEPVYDWRELRAWNIDLERLPPGSVVRYKPPSFLEQYFGLAVLITLVVAAQTLLVGALMLQSRRRRRAELASRDLSSRLINAHEEERSRIARELHDDLSQRLARLSIDASYVAANPEAEGAREVLQSMQPELVQVSKDVHDMSYRLHPSLLEDLGLATALQTECARLRRQGGANIVERIGELPAQLPQDVVLCVYRIAQEALHNAIRHAKAGTIEIAVEHDAQALRLTVRDDGVGFEEVGDRAHGGLGLSSMRERARLVGGSLQIRSRPGRGTSVNLAVPGKVTKQ